MNLFAASVVHFGFASTFPESEWKSYSDSLHKSDHLQKDDSPLKANITRIDGMKCATLHTEWIC